MGVGAVRVVAWQAVLTGLLRTDDINLTMKIYNEIKFMGRGVIGIPRAEASDIDIPSSGSTVSDNSSPFNSISSSRGVRVGGAVEYDVDKEKYLARRLAQGMLTTMLIPLGHHRRWQQAVALMEE